MKFNAIKLFTIAIILTCSSISFAQKEMKKKDAKEISGIKTEIIAQLDADEKKYLALIEATPQDKFVWRPAKGVRSIGEVFMHVAFGNYLIVSKAGATAPKDLSPQKMEKISDKKMVMAEMKKSFEFARNAIKDTKDSAMSDKADFFGRKTTKRGVLYFLTIHISEHLGQSIAYSRMNGIKPPWSSS